MMEFKTKYSQRERVQAEPSGLSRTKQSEAAACDINLLMARYMKTGDLPGLASTAGSYGDYSQLGDYHSSLNQINQADAAFMAMPADIRSRFRNDPGEFLAFMGDPSNEEEAAELGLVPKIEPAEESAEEPEPAPET